MAEVLPSSVAKETGSTQSPEALLRSLDDLLERYLNLLDAYQRAQQELTTHLSSGYMSLAQANFSSPNKIRYGEDFYDGRMRATTTIDIEETELLGSYDFSMAGSRSPFTPETPESNQGLAAHASPADEGKESRDSEASCLQKVASKAPIDPIKWFGMFVPQALRIAQSRFRSVISGVPNLASTVEEMRQVEAEVERVRGQLRSHEQT